MISNDSKIRIKRWLFSKPILAAAIYRLLYRARSARFSLPRHSYSQDGEDVFLLNYFQRNHHLNHCYIDIGANDPRMLSNTYSLYRNDWRGVTVEPIPELALKHRRVRPRDECLNAGIGASRGTVSFWETVPHVYSSFDQGAVRCFVDDDLAIVKKQIQLEILHFSDLLGQYPLASKASLLCLDTEGYDSVILSQVPWETFSPALVLSEQGPETSAGMILSAKGYRLIKTFRTNSLYERVPAINCSL